MGHGESLPVQVARTRNGIIPEIALGKHVASHVTVESLLVLNLRTDLKHTSSTPQLTLSS